MSAEIEKEAREDLLEGPKSQVYTLKKQQRESSGFDFLMLLEDNVYTFKIPEEPEPGYDLVMTSKNNEETKIELKSTKKKYCDRLYDIFDIRFSTEKEAEMFEKGKTKILRVFMGDKPHKMILFDNKLAEEFVQIETEYRSKFKRKDVSKKRWPKIILINK